MCGAVGSRGGMRPLSHVDSLEKRKNGKYSAFSGELFQL